MKPNLLREMPETDLKDSLKENYESLQNLRFQHATGQMENYKSLTNTRREIARIKTILREKELKIREKNSTKK